MTPRSLAFGLSCDSIVVGAAQLEGAHGLEMFALQMEQPPRSRRR